MGNDISANKIMVWAAVAAANHKLPKYAESILNVLPQILSDKKDIAHLEFIILYGLNKKNDAVKALEGYMDDQTSQLLYSLVCENKRQEREDSDRLILY
ncbi:EscG/YscG/SsaH family type III secretion system needle protein co-chaperone [Citrobacter rodentium]|jgi:type III secretion system protein, SsaH family|uniref:T3SS component n=2 Tax=Citrobacter rodentium TaxID=67825 RepID=D2TKD8_CITRI|nr:EscG/YscG/SsaH family type III secretion system needle protein co-chaperone [Citrobacter rodentium]AAL06386.1 unknown [Citrobacter rodentium]QBY29412.1 EscG/YscG/SsaH family type III secretion system needle protein co-chaperone [Citrobacter rodentium]UHO33190.1 EscG/YscG/SsaH family type III secretion system needle protein co-chaperone [Citrobacter rodentium NBRC 105723 = DSM 16636]CBG89707.1 T3SS component [Citrobacter rodentium ICC168]HAT8015789.1 EscG/YscG/SsaH family type III secretion 